MAKLLDLARHASAVKDSEFDVCIIGAGAAGLYLAGRLSRGGLRVAVLDAGGKAASPGEDLGIEAIFTEVVYRGATEGRAFGWGGSTSRWGGLLLPHSILDIREDTGPGGAAWATIVSSNDKKSAAVLKNLSLGGNADFFSLPEKRLGPKYRLLQERGLETAVAEFLPFLRRKMTYLVSGGKGRNIAVFLNAVAAKWAVGPGTGPSGTVKAVEARSYNDNKMRVTAKTFVIAAGGIESARILLEIDRSGGDRLLPRTAAVGKYLSDHLSCPIAETMEEDRRLAARTFGPIFVRGRMRSFRFIEAVKDPLVCRHFAHFIFDIKNPGFELAKNVLASLQAGTIPDLDMAGVLKGIHGLSGLAYDRFAKLRLFIPHDTQSQLHLDLEQAPSAVNRVRLGEKTDRFGRPAAVVAWKITEADNENILAIARRILSRWPYASPGFPRLAPLYLDGNSPKPYDAYHPVGTCRMGTDNEAVTDLELKVKGVDNLYVLSTGVLPSAGTANPTFSMLCLGDELADRLIARYSRP